MGRKITNYDRHVRIYDNDGETIDRYTAVYVKRNEYGQWDYVGMSENPFDPQGFGQHGSHTVRIDYPTSAHLGKRIYYHNLPVDCQRLIRIDLGQE